MPIKIHILFFLFCIVFASACNYGTQKQLVISSLADSTETSVAVAWEKKFTMEIPDGNFNPGFTKNAWWIKTVVSNEDTLSGEFIITFNNPHINALKVYINGDTVAQFMMGDNYPFDQRVVPDRDLLIPLTLKPQESKNLLVWVDKKGESLQLNAEVFRTPQFQKSRSNENVWMGMIGGWFILIIFICLFLYIQLKDAIYIAYGCYVLAVLGWVISNWGIGFQFIWSDYPDFASKARPFFLFCALPLFSYCILRFNPEKNKHHWMVKSHRAITTISILFIFLLVFTDFESIGANMKYWFLIGTSMLVFFWLAICLTMIIKIRNTGFGPIKYYTAAILFTIFAFICINLYQFGVNTAFQQFLNLYGSSLGLLGETTIIAYGLTFRYNHIMKEKEALAENIIIKEKGISESLIRIQEEERISIGREIHDSLGNSLAALQINIEKMELDSPAIDYSLTKSLIGESISESRAISHGLVSPFLHANGLEAALRNQVDSLQGSGKTEYLFYYDCSIEFSIPVATMIFRICCELLQNAAKHASATEISLQLIEAENEIQIVAEDNGIGIKNPNEKKGIGLSNIQFRIDYLKGRMNVDSNSSGTTFIIEISKENLHEKVQQSSWQGLSNKG